MKKYKLSEEGKEILKGVLIEILIGVLATIGLAFTIMIGLMLYCMTI